MSSDFFAMGGYAAFVWPAYAVSGVGFGLAILLTLQAYRNAKKRLAALKREKKA